MMSLETFWFLLIALLWVGYFFLEGFDFGVGILLLVLGRTEIERRVMINAIGPVWDGNEVWLIVAGAGTFAAFPEWYATLFSGFFLPLLVILLSLIVRACAFEYRRLGSTDRWRHGWDACIFAGSFLPALLWGVAFSNIVRGVHLGTGFNYTGNLFDLLNPYALLGGLATLGLFTLHGAIFLGLKTEGDIRVKADALAVRLGVPVVVIAAAYVLWTQLMYGKSETWLTLGIAALALIAAVVLVSQRREGWAFLSTGITIVAVVASLFTALYPDVMPSVNPRWTLTIHNASSSHYTLQVMTWVAVIFTPFVLLYQGWTYWVFRRRIGTQHIPVKPESPAPSAGGSPASSVS
jgi:cytochrome d ubiquinol oxidase subunit II